MKPGVRTASLIFAGVSLFSASSAPARVMAQEKQAIGDPIVVTGDKRNRSLWSTPSSVAVVSRQQIADEVLLSMDDVLDRTPNLVVDGNRTTFSIRGVDAFNVSGAGDGALASVILDGAVLPRLALAAGPLDLFDIAQIEIFRGPQSTSQGRNALAGAIFIRTIDPAYEWSAQARILATNADHQRRAGTAVGGPLIGEQMAFRLAGEVSHGRGFIHNITTDSDADGRRSQTVRAKLLLMPTALPDLQLVAGYLHDSHERGTFYAELDPPYSALDRVSTADIGDEKRVVSNIATLSATLALGDMLTLHSISNYSDILYRSVSDADRSAQAGQITHIQDRNRTFQQEVRINIADRHLTGMIGASYIRDRRHYLFDGSQSLSLRQLGVDSRLRAIGLSPGAVDSVLGLYGGVVPIINGLDQITATDNVAAFFDFSYSIDIRLQIIAGLRYDRESQQRTAIQQVMLARSLPDPASAANPAFVPVVGQINSLLGGLVAGASSASPSVTASYQAWLPKIGLRYEAMKNIVLSATMQRGYRGGGAGFNQQRAQIYDYGPEHTVNYEIGLRSTWLHDRLMVNASIYWTDWRDQQLLVALTPGSVFDTQIINVGRSRLRGIELDARGRLGQSISLYAGLGLADARFRDFGSMALVQDLQGHEFPRAPHWTMSGGATVSRQTGLFANANFNYRSGYYQDAVRQAARDISGRMLVNAKVGWQSKRIGAFIVAQNVFNVQKPNQIYYEVDGRRRGTLTDPRVVGISLEGRY